MLVCMYIYIYIYIYIRLYDTILCSAGYVTSQYITPYPKLYYNIMLHFINMNYNTLSSIIPLK